jgi:hypothetical protein
VAAAVAVGAPGAVPGSDEEARQRVGDYFAEVLLLDQGTTAAKLEPSSIGLHPTQDSSRSSATGVTATDATDEATDGSADRRCMPTQLSVVARRGRNGSHRPSVADRILMRHASVVVVKSLPHAGGRCNEAPGQPGEGGRVPRYVSRGTTGGASVRSKAAENR